jgi:glycerol 3-phosphatase-2
MTQARELPRESGEEAILSGMGAEAAGRAKDVPRGHGPASVDALTGGAWVVDLDGVMWLAGSAIPGAARAIARLRSAGVRVLFATNNAAPSVAELLAGLSRIGVEAGRDDVVTSAQAAATLIEPGERVLACGDEGLREALAGRNAVLVAAAPADAVVVGWTRAFDFDLLARSAAAVRAGARFVATNEDPTHPTPEGLLPGTGALVAAVAAASGRQPEVAGKPHEPMARLVAERAGEVALVVGDRPSTDGALARVLGVPFALVRSGVTGSGRDGSNQDASEAVPGFSHFEAADLDALVTMLLGV